MQLSILYFSTCQVLIDWLRWIRMATLLQYVYKCAVYVQVWSNAGGLRTGNKPSHVTPPNPPLAYFISFSFFLSFSSPLANFSYPRCLRSRTIWILIVFLQPPANVAMGECNGAITRQSHPICTGYEGEFVCFNSDRSNLYRGVAPMKRPSQREEKKNLSIFRIMVWEPIENLMD